MRIPVLILLSATLTLSGCQSRWNPANWWGDDPVPVGEVNPLIPDATDDGRSFFQAKKVAEFVGSPIQSVTSVEIHKVAEGNMVMVVGVASSHGVSNVRLIPANDGIPEGGVLTLELRGIYPEEPILGGSDVTREVTTAVVLTDQHLQGARTIRVAAANNSIDRRPR